MPIISYLYVKLKKGKGKKEAPVVLEWGFPPVTKVTGIQPMHYQSKKHPRLSLNRLTLLRPCSGMLLSEVERVFSITPEFCNVPIPGN